jgi:hypothetical protein
MILFRIGGKFMANLSWGGRRTLDHCGLITRCMKAGIGKPVQRSGKCEGYQKSDNDDEPCETCIECRLQMDYHDNHHQMDEYERSGY